MKKQKEILSKQKANGVKPDVNCWVFLDKDNQPNHFEEVMITNGKQVWYARYDWTTKLFWLGQSHIPFAEIKYWMRVPEIPCS